jgi:hypothetical protein
MSAINLADTLQMVVGTISADAFNGVNTTFVLFQSILKLSRSQMEN